MRRFLVGLTMVVSSLAVTASVGATPASATGALVSDATISSQPGDVIGAGEDRIWRDGAGTVKLSGSAEDGVVVDLAGGTSGDTFTFTFAAPRGEAIQSTARYSDVQRADDRTGSHAGMDVTAEGRHCNSVSGWFRVQGLFQGLNLTQITFELHCDGSPAALSGLVRYRFWEGEVAPYALSPSLEWSSVGVGSEGEVRTVTMVNAGTQAVGVDAPTVHGRSGEPTEDFVVDSTSCGVVPAGGVCTVAVRFTPTIGGWRYGSLVVGAAREVELTGFGTTGHTQLSLHSDTGDPIGEGPRDIAFTPENSSLKVSGNSTDLDVNLMTPYEDFNASFAVPSSRPIRAGEVYEASGENPQVRGGAGMRIGNRNTYCRGQGRFTILEAGYVEGTIRRLRMTFENHCDLRVAALTGSIAWLADEPAGPAPAPNIIPTPFVRPTYGSPVTDLHMETVDGIVPTLQWSDPTSNDYRGTIVRVLPGDKAPQTPTEGVEVPLWYRGAVDLGSFMNAGLQTFSVFTRNDYGDSSAPVSITLDGTHLTLDASSDSIVDGDQVVLSGRLTDSAGRGVGGQTIWVYHDFYREDEFARLGAVTTAADGTYTFTEAPTKNRHYSVHFMGSPGYLLSRPPGESTVSVAPRTQLAANRHVARRGTTVVMRGRVSTRQGTMANRPVTLQRYTKGSWRLAHKSRLSRRGTAIFRVHPSMRGPLRYRLLMRADSEHRAGKSKVVRITVRGNR
jgi:hypothetical protein